MLTSNIGSRVIASSEGKSGVFGADRQAAAEAAMEAEMEAAIASHSQVRLGRAATRAHVRAAARLRVCRPPAVPLSSIGLGMR